MTKATAPSQARKFMGPKSVAMLRGTGKKPSTRKKALTVSERSQGKRRFLWTDFIPSNKRWRTAPAFKTDVVEEAYRQGHQIVLPRAFPTELAAATAHDQILTFLKYRLDEWQVPLEDGQVRQEQENIGSLETSLYHLSCAPLDVAEKMAKGGGQGVYKVTARNFKVQVALCDGKHGLVLLKAPAGGWTQATACVAHDKKAVELHGRRAVVNHRASFDWNSLKID